MRAPVQGLGKNGDPRVLHGLADDVGAITAFTLGQKTPQRTVTRFVKLPTQLCHIGCKSVPKCGETAWAKGVDHCHFASLAAYCARGL